MIDNNLQCILLRQKTILSLIIVIMSYWVLTITVIQLVNNSREFNSPNGWRIESSTVKDFHDSPPNDISELVNTFHVCWMDVSGV